MVDLFLAFVTPLLTDFPKEWTGLKPTVNEGSSFHHTCVVHCVVGLCHSDWGTMKCQSKLS